MLRVILTSAAENTQESPNSLATFCPADVGRSQMTTFPPCRTNLSVVALPRPDAPPVTSATRPLKNKL